MRQVILDTETTGLACEQGHRVIEIGCLEIVNRRVSGKTLHFYLNPERHIDEAATEIHGLTWDDLRDKPRFRDVVDELLGFIDGAEVIIHNAPFDVAFLEAELQRCERDCRFDQCCIAVIDTLALARELHPGKRNSLDALCERYGVSNAHRKLHGALLDAELLAEVYLAMTRGQDSFEIALDSGPGFGAVALADGDWPPAGLVVLPATAAELEMHEATLARIEKENRLVPLWRRVPAPDPEPMELVAAPA
ncbi:MAG TPA: DNA polymerase III subunit epsilon [Burkholderiaceae bacterium]|nr:DNA polymerase III subunit epsilon [Burkholderiaceae bacterium]